MALVLPVFFVLIFAILEFAFYLGQVNETRHVAREAARVGGVDGGPADVDEAICGSVVLVDPADISYTLSGSGGEIGGTGSVEVAVTYDSLTGLLDWLPLGPFESQHSFFVERDRSIAASGC
jgi:hypothetical protein